MKYSVEEFDNIKTRILKYILFKKRTEQEIRLKFSKEDSELVNDAIDYLKEAGYINDEEYIERAVNEYISLKSLSLKELKYKLLSKGIDKDNIEEYIDTHNEELIQYELESAKKIILKKINSIEKEEIINFLLKKGFNTDIIKEAFEKE